KPDVLLPIKTRGGLVSFRAERQARIIPNSCYVRRESEGLLNLVQRHEIQDVDSDPDVNRFLSVDHGWRNDARRSRFAEHGGQFRPGCGWCEGEAEQD